jgi:NADH dehydrogenase [ubiquinone] 1 alpha subcomplex assembly factor 7
MLLIANEFLDALPIRQFERRGGAWHERRVGLAPDGERLALVLDPAPSPSADLISPRCEAAPDESVMEVRPAAIRLAANLARRLAAEGGAGLFIDYGHVETACGDTLQAVKAHRYHPLLEEAGSADLTAHVDFEACADAARAAGAGVCGPTTQGDFLRALGIDVRARQLLAKAAPEQRAIVESGVRRLIDAHEMGTLFKVLALTHPDLPTPAGFPASAP